MSEGRACPLHYRYRPEDLTREPVACDADVLYVVGGLYGNPLALDEIEAMAQRERASGHRVHLLFNGDFNWFNASDELFATINRRVLDHDAITGNVEYELARLGDGAGCGCAYPDFVDDAVVERSNRIMVRLQGIAANHPELQQRLARLPRYRCLMFGGLKVVVLHGDPESLAGWGLSHEELGARGNGQLASWFRQTGADVLVSTHTCLPVMRALEVDGRQRLFLNNGSAGMGNLAGSSAGLLVRIARSAPSEAAYGLPSSLPVSAALEPVRFPLSPWLSLFDALWPENTDAALSYRHRILGGTSLTQEQLRAGTGISEEII
ncbi:metallophosphoesterase family protein [Marinobacter sp. LN3S78]|uniref:metallophosphoesterase family protein n=1 Tax=Marinobacter sp. LN3S78 TaxID=3382300 RepID=UPI00387B01CA